MCAPSKVCALKGTVARRRDASICVSIISICVPHPDIHSRFIKFPIQRGGGARCRHGAMTVDDQSTGDQGDCLLDDCLLDDCLLDDSPDDGGFPAAGRRTDADPAREKTCTREWRNGRVGAPTFCPYSPLQTAPIAKNNFSKTQFSLSPNFPATGDALGGLGPAEIRARGRLPGADYGGADYGLGGRGEIMRLAAPPRPFRLESLSAGDLEDEDLEDDVGLPPRPRTGRYRDSATAIGLPRLGYRDSA